MKGNIIRVCLVMLPVICAIDMNTTHGNVKPLTETKKAYDEFVARHKKWGDNSEIDNDRVFFEKVIQALVTVYKDRAITRESDEDQNKINTGSKGVSKELKKGRNKSQKKDKDIAIVSDEDQNRIKTELADKVIELNKERKKNQKIEQPGAAMTRLKCPGTSAVVKTRLYFANKINLIADQKNGNLGAVKKQAPSANEIVEQGHNMPKYDASLIPTQNDYCHTERQLIVQALNDIGIEVASDKKANDSVSGDIYVYTVSEPCASGNGEDTSGISCREWYTRLSVALPNIKFHVFYWDTSPKNEGELPKRDNIEFLGKQIPYSLWLGLPEARWVPDDRVSLQVADLPATAAASSSSSSSSSESSSSSSSSFSRGGMAAVSVNPAAKAATETTGDKRVDESAVQSSNAQQTARTEVQKEPDEPPADTTDGQGPIPDLASAQSSRYSVEQSAPDRGNKS